MYITKCNIYVNMSNTEVFLYAYLFQRKCMVTQKGQIVFRVFQWIFVSWVYIQIYRDITLLHVQCCIGNVLWICQITREEKSCEVFTTRGHLYLYKYENVCLFVCLFMFFSAISKPIGKPFGIQFVFETRMVVTQKYI